MELSTPHQITRGRASFGKNPTPRKCKSTGRGRANGRQRGADRIEPIFRDVADEFQRDVQSFRAHPASARAERLEAARSDRESIHGISWRRSSATNRRTAHARLFRRGIEEVAADHVERGLRGEHADAFAVAGESEGFFRDAPRSSAMPMWTRPTGFRACRRRVRRCRSMPTPIVAPERLRMPSASASATSGLTAPLASIISAGTPTREVFSSLL